MSVTPTEKPATPDIGEKPPLRLIAIKDFVTDDMNDLHFKVGEIIIATEYGRNDEWWLGDVEGSNGARGGCFLSQYTRVADPASAPPGLIESQPKKGDWRNYHNQPNKKGHRISWGENTFGETWSRYEYERPDDTIDIHQSHQQWLKEEQEEKTRQMFVEWEIRERDLPEGTKCEARIKHEEANKSAEEKRIEDRRKFKERRAAKKAAESRGDATPPPPTPPPTTTTAIATTATPSTGTTSALVEPSPTIREEEDEEEEEAPPPPPRRGLPPGVDDDDDDDDDAEEEEVEVCEIPQEDEGSYEEPVLEQQDDAHEQPSAQSAEVSKAALKIAIAALETELDSLSTPDNQGISGFRSLFRDLDEEDRERFRVESCDAARENPALNRYKDILPYDSARVKLNLENPGLANYVNASRIKNLLPGSPEYFTAQGPKPATIGHFWKMVAQFRTGVIVMVTRCKEMDRVKCEQYWPTEEDGAVHFAEDEYGAAVSVVSNGESNFEYWVERRFTVLQQSGSFEVVQLHFEDWPDHGVPESPRTLISFIRKAMQYQHNYRNQRKQPSTSPCPIVVHCSAGVGRTGVWVTLYSILTYLPYMKPGDKLDIFAMVRKLRTCRRYMVQTVQQFEFCFMAALHACREFLEALSSGAFELAQQDARPDAATSARLALERAVNTQLKQSLAREKLLVAQMFELRSTLAALATNLPAPGSNPLEMMEEIVSLTDKCTRYEDQLQDQIILNHQKDLALKQKDAMLDSSNRQIFDLEEKLEDAVNEKWQMEERLGLELHEANAEIESLKLADQIIRLDVAEPITAATTTTTTTTTDEGVGVGVDVVVDDGVNVNANANGDADADVDDSREGGGGGDDDDVSTQPPQAVPVLNLEDTNESGSGSESEL